MSAPSPAERTKWAYPGEYGDCETCEVSAGKSCKPLPWATNPRRSWHRLPDNKHPHKGRPVVFIVCLDEWLR